MNISELIEFHKKGAEACEAYSGTHSETCAVTKDICKHYQNKAAWHRDAVALLEKESNLQQLMTAAENRGDELEDLLREVMDCPQVVESATVPRMGIESAPHNVVVTIHIALLRLRKVQAALKPIEGEGL